MYLNGNYLEREILFMIMFGFVKAYFIRLGDRLYTVETELLTLTSC